MKIAIAQLLSKYEFQMAPETKLEFHLGDQFLLSYDDMMIKLKKRDN